MKVRANLLSIFIAFLSGAFVCYFLAQWQFLNIDTTVNVIETIIAVISITIGIFIAVHIQKRNNQNQNLYNYLISRLDALWSDYNSFFLQIEQADTIELAAVNSFIKRFRIRNAALVKLLTPISVSSNLETLSDEFETIFANGLIRSNIVYYDDSKERLAECGSKIQAAFIQTYLSINRKS